MTDQPERPELPRYHTDDAEVVIYHPDNPLAWIAADPRDVVEVPDAA
jgi:alpha-D-ribose 1-methylphosphonate 5-triphosphate synthase subunit PhnL